MHPHLIRASAATRMLVNGARPHAVQDILGNSSLKVTARYWAVENVDKEDAVARLPRPDPPSQPDY